jgi:hypothetical protein
LPPCGIAKAAEFIEAIGRKDEPLRHSERPLAKFKIEQPLGIDRTRKLDLAKWNLLEPDARIIGRITHQDDEPVTKGLRLVETGHHQSAPDANILPVRMDGERPEQQAVSARIANFERPETDGPGQTEAGFAGDQREPVNGGIAFTQPVRCLGRAAETEGQVEQMFCGRLIGGERRFDGDDGHDVSR